MTYASCWRFWALKKQPLFSVGKLAGKELITTRKLRIISNFIFPAMHKEILTAEQLMLLPLVKSFSNDFGLVGGTAIALHLGHRRSVDFDLFSKEEFDNQKIRRKILKFWRIARVIRDETGQFTLEIKGVHLTFFHYPYPIKFFADFADVIKLPDLLTLAAMK